VSAVLGKITPKKVRAVVKEDGSTELLCEDPTRKKTVPLGTQMSPADEHAENLKQAHEHSLFLALMGMEGE